MKYCEPTSFLLPLKDKIFEKMEKSIVWAHLEILTKHTKPDIQKLFMLIK